MTRIKTKKELRFFLKADRMMNRGCFQRGFNHCLREFFIPDPMMDFLASMRYYSYYKDKNVLQRLYWGYKFRRYSLKLGFSINEDVFGYGLVIPHYGTIVVGGGNNIGNYAVLHTSTCITAGEKNIGDGLYCSTGVIITANVCLGDYIKIGANSLVNKNLSESLKMIAGNPASIRKDTEPWFMDNRYQMRHEKVELLKKNTFNYE